MRNHARSYLMEQRSGSAVWRAAALVLLLLLAAIPLVACGSSKETLTGTFSVGSSPAVEVTVGKGDVALVVGSGGEITVTAELQDPDKIVYEVSRDGDLVTVSAKTRSGSRADVTVAVPGNTEFKLSTGDGSVEVVGVQAPGEVASGNGSIMLEGVRGDVQGNLGNGHITLGDVAGSFILNVGNGGITFQGELTPGGDSTFSIGNGSVTVELTGSPSVALDLETDDGKVRSDLPVGESEVSEGRLVGNIGNGEAALTVRAGAGNITIR